MDIEDFVVVIKGEDKGLVGIIEGVSEPYTYDVRMSDGTLDIIPSSNLKVIKEEEYYILRNR